jgi:hypothetical protein
VRGVVLAFLFIFTTQANSTENLTQNSAYEDILKQINVSRDGSSGFTTELNKIPFELHTYDFQKKKYYKYDLKNKSSVVILFDGKLVPTYGFPTNVDLTSGEARDRVFRVVMDDETYGPFFATQTEFQSVTPSRRFRLFASNNERDEAPESEVAPIEHNSPIDKRDFILSVQASEDFITPTGVAFKKGDVYWIKGHSGDGANSIIQKVPNGREVPILSTTVDSKFKRFRNVSEVKTPLKTEDGSVIAPGSFVVEEAFDEDNVVLTILGDKNRATYNVNKKLFVNTKNTKSFNQDEEQFVANNNLSVELDSTYKVNKNITTLIPTENPRGPAGRVNIGQELVDMGPGEGAYSWARKVRIKGDSSGKSYYLGESYFTDSDVLEEVDSEGNQFGVVNSAEEMTVEAPAQEAPVPVKEEPKAESPRPLPTKPQVAGHYTSPEVKGSAASRQIAYSGAPPAKDCRPLADNINKIRKPDSLSKRKQFTQEVAEAANEYGIHPALLEASLTLEVNYDPRLENQAEKKAWAKKLKINKDSSKLDEAIMKNYSGQSEWGKGLGQYGPALAKKMGLKWYPPPRPSSVPPPKEYLDQWGESYKTSVWNPRAAIMSKAKHMRQTMDAELYIHDKQGNKIQVSEYLFGRGLAEQSRALLSIYNRGYRVLNSLESYYHEHGKFPESHGQIWSAKPSPITEARLKKKHGKNYKRSDHFLLGQKINHNHVYSGAGLCGEIKQGTIMFEYMKNWKTNSSKQWEFK